MIEKFDPALLDTTRGDLTVTTEFNATLDAHGLYDGLRFVVRLSPIVHDLLASLPAGIGFRSGVSPEQVQAFSTYLHETIHWWQHVGSTCGFMLSLSYPAQTHANLNHLRRFAQEVGPLKSIFEFAQSRTGAIRPDSQADLANTIINNQFDIQAYRMLATNPEQAEALVNHKMFESVGHTYHIALSQGVAALASTFDRAAAFVPDAREWGDEYRKLRDQKERGFYYGSPVELSPIGAKFIFEGQARFAQLQYLHFSSGGGFDFDEAQQFGLLGSLYTEAFDAFLNLSELDRPPTIDHPTVGLFLLICDIAINPGEGFPLQIWSHKTFLSDVDPGIRFIQLSRAVRLFCPTAADAIKNYDASEYEAVSEMLCGALKIFSPLDNCREIARWVEHGDAFRECLALHDVGKASNLNPSVQLLFGQFASYARDKRRYPHVLCWPGAAMAGHRASEDSVGVFSRQSPLFIDRADDEMIVPIIRPGLSEEHVMETFQQFYDAHALYGLTQQWITASGLFVYNYRWLQPNGTAEQMKSWADRIFANAYGVEPDAFRILARNPSPS